MKIAIYGQSYYNENNFKALHILLEALSKKTTDIYIENNFKDLHAPKHKLEVFSELDNSFDLMVTIGGDGTILRAITYVRDLNIPIVGINTGRLGFLATIRTEGISDAIHQILEGNYKITERSLLEVSSEPKHEAIEATNFALNEIALSRKNTTSMITVETHLNDEYLTSYWADGLIISTPTGSTGYSLSCGGPVITPKTNSFVVTPIAPHNLSARPLVIPDDTKIKLKVSGREDQFLMSLDSRIVTLQNTTVVTVKKALFSVKLVELLDESFIDTLRKKLLWGEDRRN